MAIYKNISFKVILNKIYRDLGLDDSNYVYDLIEWGGEALNFIGSSSQFEQIEETLIVEDHKALIPTNFITLQQLKFKENDCWKLIEYNPSTFRGVEEDCPNKFIKTEESFSLNPNYILTTFEEGEILVSYKSFPVDEDGFPLVPDNQYFKEALFWYCYRQMIFRGYKPKVDQITYDFADHKWKFYCSGARNKANYPDITGYQRFRDVWVGLIPNDLDKVGFDDFVQKSLPIEKITADGIVTNPSGIQDVILDGGSA